MKEEKELLSLFEYLGKGAGKELGSEVYQYAKEHKSTTATREVDTKNYKGKVMLYERSLLEEFFKTKTNV